MLNFRDADHFDKYINFLGQAMDNIDPDDSTKDEHDVLLEIEDGLGLTSIRNISHTAFMKQNEIGWPTIEKIPDEHFINSLDFKSVLNSDLEVRIGDEIIHYINKDYLVRVDAEQTNVLEKFRGLSTSATFDDIRNVDIGQQYTTIQLLTDVGFVWEKRKPIPTPTGDLDLSNPWTGFRDPCSNPHLLSIRNIALYDGYLSISYAKFVIDFGDGTAPVTKYAQPSEVLEFTHLYSTGPGNYNIMINAYTSATSNTVVAQKVIPVTVLDGGCRKVEKNSGWYYKIVGNKAVSGNIYIHYTGGLFGGTFKMRMDATTRSMEYKDGQWKLVKATIGLHSLCSVKNVNCTQVGSLEATDEKNKKEFAEHRTWDSQFYWTTASCEHYIYINGTKHTLQVSMNSCP